MSRRTDRLGEALRHEIGRMILAELHDPRIGFVTVTRVEVSADLSLAKVFVSVLEPAARERATLRGLNSARKRLQLRLGENLKLRRLPEIAFHLDPGVKRSIRISSILSDIARERAARTGTADAPGDAAENSAPEETQKHDG
jgi:ribosome-binding factor A